MRRAPFARLHLKSKLLAGASAAAAVTACTAAAADTGAQAEASRPKWLPYAEVGAGLGSGYAAGRIDAFVPIVQDLDSLLFVRIGDDLRGTYANNVNAGLGYRTKVDGWILGAFAGFDSTQTGSDHSLHQFSLGLEAMSVDWDFHANAYIADNSGNSRKSELLIQDTTIAILQHREAALSGFDGEIGYRVFNTDDTDVRLFAGGYTYRNGSDAVIGGKAFGVSGDISGAKARAEVSIYDIDALGLQSRLTLNAEVSHDHVNHTTEFVGATLRIALDDLGSRGAQALDALDRRMVDEVRRSDNVLSQQQFSKPEPVIIYNGHVTSQPTNALYYVEQRPDTGAGTYKDPTTLQDATARGPNNQFIVLTDRGGSTIDSTGAVIQQGETVAGAGTFKVRGANSGKVFTHDFAPASGAVSLGSSGGNAITLSSDSSLYGVTITGGFHYAIYGHNVHNVSIDHVTIDGGGTGGDGIVINQDAAGSANVSISNTTITGVTDDGVKVDIGNSTGETSAFNMTVSASTIGAGHEGIALRSNTDSNSDTSVYVGVHDSAITAGGSGVAVGGAVTAGSTLSQDVLVDPTTISGGTYGILVKSTADGGAITQSVTVDDVDIYNTTHAGIAIYGSALHGGSLDQSISLTNSTLHDTGIYGIALSAAAETLGIVHQTMDLSNDSFTGAGGFGAYHARIGGGISVDADAKNGGQIDQVVDILDVSASHNSTYGVHALLYADGYDGNAYARVAQEFHLTNSDFSYEYKGFYVRGLARNGAELDQQIFADQVTTDSDFFGIGGSITGLSSIRPNAVVGSTVNSSIHVENSDLNSTMFFILAGSGIVSISGAPRYYGVSSATQHLYLDSISASRGADFYVEGGGNSSYVTQYIAIANSEFDHGGEGVMFRVSGRSASERKSLAKQTIDIQNSEFDNNSRHGLYGIAIGYGYGGRAEQDFHIENSEFDGNSYYGATFYRMTRYPGSHPGYHCLPVSNCAAVLQQVFIKDSQFDGNTRDGLLVRSMNNFGEIYGSAGSGAPTISIQNSDFSGNTHNGLSLAGRGFGFTQYLVAVDSTFDNNHRDGIYSENYVGAGTMLQLAHIYSYAGSSSASNNGGSGVHFLTVTRDVGTYANVALNIEGINASYNHETGHDFYGNPVRGGIVLDTEVFYNLGAGSNAVATLSAYGNTLLGEQTGIASIANGGWYSLPTQHNYVGGNTIGHDAYGLSGVVIGKMYWDLHQGNTLFDNGVNYQFHGNHQYITY